MDFPKIFDKYIKNTEYCSDRIGKSDAGVYLFDDFVLKVQPNSIEAANELQMLQWLKGKVNVPDIIEQTVENDNSYILMSRCDGDMICADEFMATPIKQAEILAEILCKLWSIATESCPCSWLLDARLNCAMQNVISGKVDITEAQPETFGRNGFKDPEELLEWLIQNKPEETQVISHGDFCLPNIFVKNDRLTGLIDLGKSGIADPYQDIALCYRSLSNNYAGVYNGRKYSGFKDEVLFDTLGIKPDCGWIS